MNANPEPHGPVEPRFDEYDHDDGFEETLPIRPHRPFLTKWTAGLMALVVGGAGFYIGVRLEKSKFPATGGSAAGGTSAFARALAGAGGTSTTRGSFASRLGAAGGFAGFGGASSNATVGSVSSASGNTLYVTSSSGNTVKVKLSSQTAITKTETVGKSKIYPGDEVVIQGAKGSGGTVTATSITDSGSRSTSTSSGSGSSGTGSGSSVISSLFGGG